MFSPYRPYLLITFEKDIFILIQDLSICDPSRRELDKLEDGEVRYGLTTAALTDYAQGLTLSQGKRDVVYCMHYPTVSLELCFQSMYFQYWLLFHDLSPTVRYEVLGPGYP